MFLLDHSKGQKFESEEVWFILMIAGPGILVALGSFLQAACRKVWPVAIVLLGSLAASWFIGAVANFLFAYTGDRFALKVVYLYLVLLMTTIAASIINAVVQFSLQSQRVKEA